MKVKY
jgi:hypothetical protein